MGSEDPLNSILTNIAAQISAVTGIGKVHLYMRWAISEGNFETIAVTGGRVNVWQVTRTSTEERWLTAGEVWRSHQLTIYGAYGLLDAPPGTEGQFQALVERIATRFRTRSMLTLNDTVEAIAAYHGAMAGVSTPVGAIAGIQVQRIEHRTYHNKLVHWCELGLGIQETPQRLID
jgi:hypothetical protein